MSCVREVYSTELLDRPTRVIVEASWDTIYTQELDELEGEHFDSIHDVIKVEFTRDDVVLTTCRTLERPDRTVITLPRNAVAHVFIPEESGHVT